MYRIIVNVTRWSHWPVVHTMQSCTRACPVIFHKLHTAIISPSISSSSLQTRWPTEEKAPHASPESSSSTPPAESTSSCLRAPFPPSTSAASWTPPPSRSPTRPPWRQLWRCSERWDCDRSSSHTTGECRRSSSIKSDPLIKGNHVAVYMG